VDELVDPYWVALSIELENSNSYITENTYINVDELNVILSTNWYRDVDKDDDIDLEFNKEYDIGHEDDENEEENSD
jgi:hypothetical protein